MESKQMGNYGLVFESELYKGPTRLDIVAVGDADCGKTQLIQRFLNDPVGYAFVPHNNYDQYFISLPDLGPLQIFIFDVKNTEYLRTAAFNKETVFLFCFNADAPESLAELESSWIPIFLQRAMPNMYRFSVAIERDPDTNTEALAGIDRQELRMNLEDKARRVSLQHGSRLLKCSLSDRDSILKVFQSALDEVFPWTWYN